jgi:hypothetical protein
MTVTVQAVVDVQYVTGVLESVFHKDLLSMLIPDGKGGVNNGARLNLTKCALALYDAVRANARNKNAESQKKVEDCKGAFSTFLSFCTINQSADISEWAQEMEQKGKTFEAHYTDTLVSVFENKVSMDEKASPPKPVAPRTYLQ